MRSTERSTKRIARKSTEMSIGMLVVLVPKKRRSSTWVRGRDGLERTWEYFLRLNKRWQWQWCKCRRGQ